SPDGRTIAYLCSRGRGEKEDVCIMPAAGGEWRNLTARWPYDPNGLHWGRLSNFVEFEAEYQGSIHKFRIELRGGRPVEQVTHGLRTLGGFSYDNEFGMAYTSSDITHPVELYVAGVDGSAERKLTSFNDA